MIAISLNDNQAIYKIGDVIELVLRADTNVILAAGDIMQVEIRGMFDELIDTAQAERIGDIYAASLTIPLNLPVLYDPLKLGEADASVYFLKDKWIVDPTTSFSFPFVVDKTLSDPNEANCVIKVEIDNIEDVNGNKLEPYEIEFTTRLSPFYCTIADVISVHPKILDTVDVIDVAKEIYFSSKYIDNTLRPNKIVYQDKFDFACRGFARFHTAYSMLASSDLNVTSESKQIDTFKIQKQYNEPGKILRNIDEQRDKYALMILAGGLDTPYTSKTFIKGLYDPNRVQANRAGLDLSDDIPFVNVTTDSTITMIDGNAVEIRGERTVAIFGAGPIDRDLTGKF